MTGMQGLYALPPGVDFAGEVVRGLLDRMGHLPPEALAGVTIYGNSSHTLRAIEAAFHEAGPVLLPRLRLLAEIGSECGFPPPAPPLARQLELAHLVARAMASDDTGQSVAAMTRSLAELMAEMQAEGLGAEALDGIDAEDHAAHWQRALAFLRIAARFHLDGTPIDREAQARAAAERLAADWAEGRNLPQGPVIVAGSSGSHGATRLFMEAVAHLPQGAVILPGYDPALPESVAAMLRDGNEDHPQARLAPLAASCGAPRPWTDAAPPDAARNRLLSLALRPAPVTDQWVAEGPSLGDLGIAAAGMTLIEADSPADEAGALAVLIRDAVHRGEEVTLISAERGLTRRVAAALDRWGIIPDDSAGVPLPLTAAGRFARHIAELPGRPLGIDTALILLKHPLTATGRGRWARRAHLLRTRELELHLRRNGPAFPDGAALRKWGEQPRRGKRDEARVAWAEGIAALLDATLPLIANAGPLPLAERAARHRQLAELWAAGPGGSAEASALYAERPGEKLRAVMDHIALHAARGPLMSARDFARLLSDQLQAQAVRADVEAHPLVRIRGPREARTEARGLVILGGLNEGGWPQPLDPDPWLSRPMRRQAGLTLPERRIGLAAHDFQIAAAAPKVVLSRAHRSDEAETIPSRWLNRLVNLMNGLGAQNGPAALAAMRARGQHWLDCAAALAAPGPSDMAPLSPRPSPRPPAPALRELSVTAVSQLIRDPYAIYARHVLRLRPLDPLRPEPDAAERGNVLHAIIQTFLSPPPAPDLPPEALMARLMEAADRVLAQVPWPSVRLFWRARIAGIARQLVRDEHERLQLGTPLAVETRYQIKVAGMEFTLTARPDRIDRLADGTAVIYDYKSGTPPSRPQILSFDKQLPLEAAMAERGVFGPPMKVADLRYIRLGGEGETTPRGWDDEMQQTWDQFVALISAYLRGEHGFTARRAMERMGFGSDYDHLARYGEWSEADPPQAIRVGHE